MEQIVTNVLKPELKFESKKNKYRYINKDVEKKIDKKINDKKK